MSSTIHFTQFAGRPRSPSVVLDDGLQDIVVDYFKRGSGSMGLQLLWRLEPDASSEVVPWLYFVPPPELVAPP